MKNIITLDGYKYTVIYRQPTAMNTLCVYEIQNIHKANEDPVYFLASYENNEWLIKKSTFNQMKTHIAPQHFEGFFKEEFTAILMAKNIAMNSYIEQQKFILEKTQKALAETTEKLINLQSCISFENCDAYKQYYDSQEELRRAAVNREKEEKNND